MADRYWVGGTGTWNTTSTTNWSATSGGTSGASVPTAADSVFFDQATTYTVTMTGALACLDLTVSAGTVTFATGTTPTLNIVGSFSVVSSTVWNATGVISFTATSSKTITTNGCVINAPCTFNGVGGIWQLQDALTIGVLRTTLLSNGTIDLNSFTLTTGLFSSSNPNTRTIAFGTGNITVIGSGTVWNTASITGFSVTGTPTVNVSNNTATATTVSTGALPVAQSINFNYTTGTYTLTETAPVYRNLNLTGFAGTFQNSARTIYGDFNAGSTATINSGINATTFASTSGIKTITTNGLTLNFPLTFNGVGGTWQLQDALTSGVLRTTTLTAGTLDLNGFTFTTGLFVYTSSATVRAIAFGTGNITVIGSGAVWNGAILNFTVTGTPTVNVSNNSATATTVTTGLSIEAQSLSFNYTTGTYPLTNTGNYRSLNLTGFAGTFPNSGRIIYGDFNAGSTATFTAGTNTTSFQATSGIKTIATNGRTIDFPLTFAGTGGTWQLQDALTVGIARLTQLNAGTLDLNSFTLTTGLFQISGGNVRAIAFGTGNITLIGSGTVWSGATVTNFSRTGTPTINVSNNSSLSATVTTGPLTEAQALDFNYTTGTYTLTSTGNYRSLNLTGFAGTYPNSGRTIYGDLNLGTTATLTAGLNTTTFAATSGTKTITSNGLAFNVPLAFNGTGGTWQLQDALSTTQPLILTNGTFDAANYSVTCSSVLSSGSGVRTLALGSATWTITTFNTVWDFSTPTNATVTGTATISLTSTSTKTFAGGGIQTWPTLNQGGTGALTVSGSNKFANITNTAVGSVLFTGGTTNEFSAFNLNGTSTAARLTLGSTNTTQAILKKPSAWFVGAGSVDSGNNSGLTFTAGGGIDYLNISYINGQLSTPVIPPTINNNSAFFLLF